MSPAAYQSFLVLAIGFSLSGLLTSAYQVVMLRPPSFRVLGMGFGRVTLRAMPFVIFAAPAIIVRNVLRGANRRRGGSARERFFFSLIAALIAGSWSLLSGSVAISGLRALGLIAV